MVFIYFLKNKFNNNSKNQAFTLTEVIIVMAIFCLLVTVIYSIFLLNQRIYTIGENVSEITQNGRVILERMIRELRQAKLIISNLPTTKDNAPSEIKFQDGHSKIVSETGNAQGGSANTIILSAVSSSIDDYYKDLYVKIISGTGQGQVKKIYKYIGSNKTALIEGNWSTIPDVNSVYKIDSSFYYIYYYKDSNNNILRKVYTYCLSSNGVSCVSPETYVAYNTVPPSGFSLLEIVLEEPRVIGQYVDSLRIWSSGIYIIDIFITLKEKDKTINLETEIFGRNL
jgi:prepilin-type N-terminal cleavage/methylation domain-containing protein